MEEKRGGGRRKELKKKGERGKNEKKDNDWCNGNSNKMVRGKRWKVIRKRKK